MAIDTELNEVYRGGDVVQYVEQVSRIYMVRVDLFYLGLRILLYLYSLLPRHLPLSCSQIKP